MKTASAWHAFLLIFHLIGSFVLFSQHSHASTEVSERTDKFYQTHLYILGDPQSPFVQATSLFTVSLKQEVHQPLLGINNSIEPDCFRSFFSLLSRLPEFPPVVSSNAILRALFPFHFFF